MDTESCRQKLGCGVFLLFSSEREALSGTSGTRQARADARRFCTLARRASAVIAPATGATVCLEPEWLQSLVARNLATLARKFVPKCARIAGVDASGRNACWHHLEDPWRSSVGPPLLVLEEFEVL